MVATIDGHPSLTNCCNHIAAENIGGKRDGAPPWKAEIADRKADSGCVEAYPPEFVMDRRQLAGKFHAHSVEGAAGGKPGAGRAVTAEVSEAATTGHRRRSGLTTITAAAEDGPNR